MKNSLCLPFVFSVRLLESKRSLVLVRRVRHGPGHRSRNGQVPTFPSGCLAPAAGTLEGTGPRAGSWVFSVRVNSSDPLLISQVQAVVPPSAVC